MWILFFGTSAMGKRGMWEGWIELHSVGGFSLLYFRDYSEEFFFGGGSGMLFGGMEAAI